MDYTTQVLEKHLAKARNTTSKWRQNGKKSDF